MFLWQPRSSASRLTLTQIVPSIFAAGVSGWRLRTKVISRIYDSKIDNSSRRKVCKMVVKGMTNSSFVWGLDRDSRVMIPPFENRTNFDSIDSPSAWIKSKLSRNAMPNVNIILILIDVDGFECKFFKCLRKCFFSFFSCLKSDKHTRKTAIGILRFFGQVFATLRMCNSGICKLNIFKIFFRLSLFPAPAFANQINFAILMMYSSNIPASKFLMFSSAKQGNKFPWKKEQEGEVISLKIN